MLWARQVETNIRIQADFLDFFLLVPSLVELISHLIYTYKPGNLLFILLPLWP